MKKAILSMMILIAGTSAWLGCSNDDPKPDQTVAAEMTSFKITAPFTVSGTLTGTDVALDIAADEVITACTVEIVVPEGATVSPASGTNVNLTSPVDFTVTGKDKDGNPVTATYIVTANLIPVLAFIGKSATIDGLEDDAKAAANWMETQYGSLFTYMPAANITTVEMSKLKVAFYYELQPVSGELAVDLGTVADKATIIGNWVRDGGNLFLAGDAADMIFKIGRVPVAEANFNEICCSGVEENHAADDYWGFSAVTTTTSADRTGHPLYTGLLDIDDRLYLNNAPTREVRLFWWNVGPAGGSCCVDEAMVTNFEKKYKATKLASLRHVGDYFGFAAVEFGRTDLDTDASFSANVTKDFKGTVLMFSNAIIGYEWNVNDGTTNEYADNIKAVTKNGIDYLKGL